MASISRVIYIGVTHTLVKRVTEHKNGKYDGFTKKYRCHKLVYFEDFTDINRAIAREKELKGWKRSKKIMLIESENPGWLDLYPNIVELSKIRRIYSK